MFWVGNMGYFIHKKLICYALFPKVSGSQLVGIVNFPIQPGIIIIRHAYAAYGNINKLYYMSIRIFEALIVCMVQATCRSWV